MIYFDNAATTMLKPPEVAEAVAHAINSFGGVGRGAHGAALAADMVVHRCRTQLAALFGAPDARRACFTHNATEGLNIAISGLLHPGEHAVTTAASHNSVLRPLNAKVAAGAELAVVAIAPDASVDLAEYEAAFRPNTRLAVLTHASNLTGDVYDIAAMARIAHEHGALVVVDAAQTAGVIDIDMVRDGIDVLCLTGHKSLYGPQGTGAILLNEGVELPAYNEGGSGTHSYDERQPAFYPEHLEAGTLNGHGIAGLSAGIGYIERVGVAAIHNRVGKLAAYFEQHASRIPGVRIYGGHGGIDRTGVVALNLGELSSAELSDMLSHEYDICTRPGAHCAPLMHAALGTMKQGCVRFSFSSFNTADEVDRACAALEEIAGELA